MNDELRMAELLCTRLCHDLTGPIGAVNNGAEFLSEEGFNMQSQAVELIVSSAFSAVTRLQFYRLAYGLVKEGGEANLLDSQKLASDFFAAGKITLDWPDNHAEGSDVSISIKMVRLIFNLLIVASSTLMRGGMLSVRIDLNEAGAKRLRVCAKGSHLKWDKEMEDMLTSAHNTEELDPKNVQLQLTRSFIDDLNAALACQAGEEEITFEVVQQLPAH